MVLGRQKLFNFCQDGGALIKTPQVFTHDPWGTQGIITGCINKKILAGKNWIIQNTDWKTRNEKKVRKNRRHKKQWYGSSGMNQGWPSHPIQIFDSAQFLKKSVLFLLHCNSTFAVNYMTMHLLLDSLLYSIGLFVYSYASIILFWDF